MRKTRKENKVREGGGRRGADKVTTRRKTRRRRDDEDNDVFVGHGSPKQRRCSSELRVRVPLHFKAAPFIGCVNFKRIARFIHRLSRGIAATAAAHA